MEISSSRHYLYELWCVKINVGELEILKLCVCSVLGFVKVKQTTNIIFNQFQNGHTISQKML